eukprot:1194376-Prorocentrum_minimum.AAC.2
MDGKYAQPPYQVRPFATSRLCSNSWSLPLRLDSAPTLGHFRSLSTLHPLPNSPSRPQLSVTSGARSLPVLGHFRARRAKPRPSEEAEGLGLRGAQLSVTSAC